MLETYGIPYLLVGAAIAVLFLLGFVRQRAVQSRLAKAAGLSGYMGLSQGISLLILLVMIAVTWPFVLAANVYSAGLAIALRWSTGI